MHIPENYLSPETCAVLAVAAIPALYVCAKRVKEKVSQDQLPLVGVGAAVSFLLMMLNIPVPGGTSAHAVGGTLLAVLLGPEAAVLAVSAALLIQAVFFGDGGILALGANIFNISIMLPICGYGTFKLLEQWMPNTVAAAIGGYVGINVAAFLTAVEFGIQPMLFHDINGLALYSPYPLSISIPAMMIAHLTIAGLAETIFTGAIYSFVRTIDTGKQAEAISLNKKALYGLIAFLIVICPLGLITEVPAWGEWGSEEIAEVVHNGTVLGYTPVGMVNGFEWTSPITDYEFPGLPEVTGYIVSAIIGVALLVIIFKLASSLFYSPKGVK